MGGGVGWGPSRRQRDVRQGTRGSPAPAAHLQRPDEVCLAGQHHVVGPEGGGGHHAGATQPGNAAGVRGVQLKGGEWRRRRGCLRGAGGTGCAGRGRPPRPAHVQLGLLQALTPRSPPPPPTWMASLYAPAPPLAQAAEGSDCRNQGSFSCGRDRGHTAAGGGEWRGRAPVAAAATTGQPPVARPHGKHRGRQQARLRLLVHAG